MSNGPPVILASSSASRQALLTAAGLDFTALPAHVDEEAYKLAYQADGVSATDAAIGLAEVKALRISARHPAALVIGADQMLECEGVWFDKPTDRARCRQQLITLRGKTHRLFSAVVIAHRGERIWHTVGKAAMTMRAFTDGFLETYLDRVGEAVYASVGGYQVEGMGIQLFEKIEGDQSTILGLPMLPILDFLRNWDSVER